MQKSIVSKLGDEIAAFSIAVGLITVLAFTTGCSKSSPPPSVTKDTLEIRSVAERITDFRNQRTQESMNAVDRAFVDLDKEIAELEVYVKDHDGMKRQEAQGKLDFMKSARSDLMTDFNKAKISNTADKVSQNVENTVKGH